MHNRFGVKQETVAGNPHRPEPHISRSVLYDPDAGTGFANEAFKVTNNGYAVPKSPGADAGLKQAPNGSSGSLENGAYKDTVMMRAHTNLPE